MIDKSIRQYYESGQLVQPGKGRPGYGGHRGGAEKTARAGGKDPQGGSPHRDPAPVVTTAKAPPSILAREQEKINTIADYAEREAIRIKEAEQSNRRAEAVKLMTQPTTVQKAPFEGARTIDTYTGVDPYKMNYLNRDLPGTYRSESLLPSGTVPPSMRGGAEDALWTPPIKDIVDLGDDAKAKHIQTVQKQAVVDWNNKTEREREEHREKLQTAQEKLKSTKGGGFWKSLGNIALAMVLPALLPAKLAQGYNLYKTAKTATAWAKKLGLTDTDVMQYVQKNILKGADFSSLIAGDQNEIAKSISKYTGKTDTSKEYTEKTIGEDRDGVTVQLAEDVETTGDQITNEQREQVLSRLEEAQGVLQKGYFIDKDGIRQQLTDDHRRQLSDYMNHLHRSLNPTTQGAAHGGRIDGPLMGGSRYI